VIPPTPQAFARAFLEVPDRRDTQAIALAKKAAERFSIDGQLDRMIALYESLLRPARIA
jgi:hypothetical protein